MVACWSSARAARGRVRAAFAAFLLPACSGHLPRPAYSPQPTSALVEVGLPPPPGRVEVLPAAPNRSAVWVDGEWLWRRDRWAWLPGRWVEPPRGATFSPWVFVRGPDGRLWYARGAWRDAHGAPVAAPAPLGTAEVDSADVVDASGTDRPARLQPKQD